MSAFFNPRPSPRGGGGGRQLFCQAITGPNGLHGTDVGTENQTRLKMAFLESAPRMGGLKSGHLPPF